MNETVFRTIAVTGFGIAFFHAAIPTHWLPFVLTARAQGWAKAKTLAVTALAGTGHVVITALLGLFVAWFGIALNEQIGQWFPRLAGGAVILLGLFYLYRQLSGKTHAHLHLAGVKIHTDEFEQHERASDHGHEEGHHHTHTLTPRSVSDFAAISGLMALLTFSPCEGFIPIYMTGASYGWRGFILLTVILSIATVAGMLAFVGLALAGLEQLKLQAAEKYESGLMGVLLCAVGLFIILFEH